MDEFCGSPFWNTSTWNTSSPDLTFCFQRTVLVWAPCAYLCVFAFLEIYFIANSRGRNVPGKWTFYSKFVLNLLLITISVYDLIKAIHKSSFELVNSVEYATPCIQAITFIIAIIILFYNKKYGIQTSGVLFIFWFLLTICGMVQFRSYFIRNEDPTYPNISFFIYYFAVIAMFIINFFADPEPEYSEYLPVEKPSPEQNASFPSRLTFFWFDAMAWKGFRKPIETTDLWSLNPEDSAKEIVPSFEKYCSKGTQFHWSSQETEAKFKTISSAIDFNKKRKKKDTSLFWCLFRVFGPTFLFSALLYLITDVMNFFSPKILGLLINYTPEQEPTWKGHFYAVLLLVISLLQNILTGQFNNGFTLVGLRIQTALTSAIFKKALRMSHSARKEFTVGEIVNLLSVDAQRFSELQYVNPAWMAPVEIILCLYFLWEILGVATLAGLAVMILLIPINSVFVKKQTTLYVKQMKNRDKRMKMTSEVLNGIKVLKLYEIMKIRKKEIKVMNAEAYVGATFALIWTWAPFIVSLATFAIYVSIDEKNVLDSATAFVSLSLFNILRSPFIMLPFSINYLVEIFVSTRRINKFLNMEDLDMDNVHHDFNKTSSITLKNASFYWDEIETESPALKNISFQVQSGQLVAIVGKVGSGKSSLLSAVLGEMQKIGGSANTEGSIAYVSQQAFIQNETVQGNILFGKKLEKSLYDQVLDSCALKPDLEMLSAGDKTEIGEKGINLSGGQKQRISLARAAYNDAQVYLLDDPLSAVDSHVGKHIFENLIGPKGMLSQKTRILVTHGLAYLPQVDKIIVMKDGEISESGTYKELLDKKGAFAEFLMEHLKEFEEEDLSEDFEEIKHHLESAVGQVEQKAKPRTSNSSTESHTEKRRSSQRLNSVSSQISKTSSRRFSTINELANKNMGEKIIEDETTETGQVGKKVYWYYFNSVGWFYILAGLILNAVAHGLSVGSNVCLGIWSNDKSAVVDGKALAWKRDMYLGVYAAFGILQGLVLFGTVILMTRGSIRASTELFKNMIHRILKCPMAFFDSTPIGRILNRLGKDIEVVDNVIPHSIRWWEICFFTVISTLVVISSSTPEFIIVVIPIAILYAFILIFYVATSRQLKRLESIFRSPIFSFCNESVLGAPTIRAFDAQKRFIQEFEGKIDHFQRCTYASRAAGRWLTLRLEMIGSFIIYFSALFAVLSRDVIDDGAIGLSISYALQITANLNWLVVMTSEIETNIVTVERIKEYCDDTPQEAAWEIPKTEPKNWPSMGQVEFRDYKVRYREGLELVLNGLSFVVQSGEKIGIVGRTGAGKSSLTLSLFRIIEAAEGKIFIDGVDISSIGLHALRSKLTIIPQDPVLFSGTLRFNLDPFDRYNDEEIWRSLALSHLKTFVESQQLGILHEVSEGGENLSVGQRQLICLARALLRKTKILILDEATAGVDLDTDNLIQKTIREEFQDCTVLTIAHRLNTIIDADRVMVLDKGNTVEFESPAVLLQNDQSVFYSMAKDAGLTI